MAQNINSAYRIKLILETARPKSAKLVAHDVWAEIFNVVETDQHKKNFTISRCLADLHDEVESVRSEMLRLGYSDNLFSPSLNKCNSIFSVPLIMGHWQAIQQQITPEISIALGFCLEILPNEEVLIEQKELDELSKLAKDLRGTLQESSLPQHTKNIIEKHLAKIENAISSYKVVGAKALEDVMQSAYGEVIANEVIFQEAKGSEELGKLSLLWQKTKTIIDGVSVVNKGISNAQGMAEKGQNLIEFLQGFNV